MRLQVPDVTPEMLTTTTRTGAQVVFNGDKNGERVKIQFVNKGKERWLQVTHKGQLLQLKKYKDEETAKLWLIGLVKKYINGEVDKPAMEVQKATWLLQNGADDIDGTVVWYDITKVDGAGTHQDVTQRDLQRAAREARFRPLERDTLYRPVRRDGRDWTVDA